MDLIVIPFKVKMKEINNEEKDEQMNKLSKGTYE